MLTQDVLEQTFSCQKIHYPSSCRLSTRAKNLFDRDEAQCQAPFCGPSVPLRKALEYVQQSSPPSLLVRPLFARPLDQQQLWHSRSKRKNCGKKKAEQKRRENVAARISLNWQPKKVETIEISRGIAGPSHQRRHLNPASRSQPWYSITCRKKSHQIPLTLRSFGRPPTCMSSYWALFSFNFLTLLRPCVKTKTDLSLSFAEKNQAKKEDMQKRIYWSILVNFCHSWRSKFWVVSFFPLESTRARFRY